MVPMTVHMSLHTNPGGNCGTPAIFSKNDFKNNYYLIFIKFIYICENKNNIIYTSTETIYKEY